MKLIGIVAGVGHPRSKIIKILSNSHFETDCSFYTPTGAKKLQSTAVQARL
jgi:hypothetical protein